MAKKKHNVTEASTIVKFNDLVEHLRSSEEQRTMKKEIGIYLCFLTIYMLFLFLTAASSISGSFNMQTALYDTFVYKPFPLSYSHVPRNFEGISTYQHIFDWMGGVLKPGLFPSSSSTNSTRFIVDGTNYLLWGVKFRQQRVAPDSCDLQKSLEGSSYTNFDYVCKAGFSSNTEDTSDLVKGGTTYTYESEGQFTDTSINIDGTVASYDGGGYVIRVAPTEEALSGNLTSMYLDRWLDTYTRAFFVTFGLYNPNSNLFGSCTFMVEFSPEGLILPNSYVRTVQLEPRTNTDKTIESLLLYVLFAFVLYYIVGLFKEVYQGRSSIFTIIDAITMILFLIQFTTRIPRAFTFKYMPDIADPDFSSLAQVQSTFRSIEEITHNRRYEQYIAAVAVMFAFLRVFKFLQMNVKLAILFYTVQQASHELINFTVLFTILFTGFALFSYLVFGVQLASFRKVQNSISTLLQMILGNFDYTEMQQTSPTFAPIFFTLFMVLFAFILINIFLAIILDAYTTVAEKAKAGGNLDAMMKQDIERIYKKIRSIIRWLRNPKKKGVKKVPKAMLLRRLQEMISYRDGKLISLQQLGKELSAEGIPLRQVEALFKQVDQIDPADVKTDEDGVMTLSEDADKVPIGPAATALEQASGRQNAPMRQLSSVVQGLFDSQQQAAEAMTTSLNALKHVQEDQIQKLGKLEQKLDRLELKF
eukprot:GILK01008010.1.p1 GENE.GILK01008010.1~~GILK01008010.1.p1  ORF type:complete len:720 (+),score=110.35 GILK01008010.1:59-2161(+)